MDGEHAAFLWELAAELGSHRYFQGSVADHLIEPFTNFGKGYPFGKRQKLFIIHQFALPNCGHALCEHFENVMGLEGVF